MIREIEARDVLTALIAIHEERLKLLGDLGAAHEAQAKACRLASAALNDIERTSSALHANYAREQQLLKET